tara:strand:+ start:1138 stop:2106 length:969 start_codon:yes stop_codon:yes gene_type:complete
MSVKEKLKIVFKKKFYTAPKELRQNQILFEKEQLSLITSSLKKNYLDRGTTKSNLQEREYKELIHVHLHKRLAYNRNRIIPWLDQIKKLKNSQILEIGCGTGVSTLALSEQGAKVSGVDVDEGALKVAKDRLNIAGIEADLHFSNGDEIKKRFGNKKFDFIIFYAVLEHMTVKERLASLKQAWEILPKDGLLVILETPNRLWFYDSHTAALPFYDWLPDDLAFYYSKFSKRNNFKDKYRELNEDELLKFKRWGRGASYHEFELAIDPVEDLNVISSLMKFEKTAFLKQGLKGLQYIKFLKSQKKSLPEAFCYPYLDLVIKKD